MVQRHSTRDPVSDEGGINLYAYAGGNPIQFVGLRGLGANHEPADVFLDECTDSKGCDTKLRSTLHDFGKIGSEFGNQFGNQFGTLNPIVNATTVISDQQYSGRSATKSERAW